MCWFIVVVRYLCISLYFCMVLFLDYLFLPLFLCLFHSFFMLGIYLVIS